MTNLSRIMKYNFKEKNLGPDFCKDRITEIQRLINNSVSFSVVGMPGIGISIFLKYLATLPFAHFLHVDVYELPSLTRVELLKLLLKELGGNPQSKTYQQLIKLCQKHLESLVKNNKRAVIIFNRFDQLKEEFDKGFFNNLRTVRDVDKEKVVIIFAVNKPLYEIAPEAIDIGNINMYSKTFYLKPYSEKELKELLHLNTPNLENNKLSAKRALVLSGGHYQLLQLLLKSEKLENPLLDPFVKLQLKELYDYLNYSQKKQLQRIAMGKRISSTDQFLLDAGIVKQKAGKYQLFTPLFAEFIKSIIPLKLPIKETRLFRLLKKNLGSVVSKEEIFNTVWSEDPTSTSDWALNALIYRLRKNPVFAVNGYLIESQKKIGYTLFKV